MSESDPKMTRRSLLEAAIRGGVAVWIGGMAYPIAAYLWPARESGPHTGAVSAGSVKDFAVGTARMVKIDGRPVLVIRTAEDRYRAFSAICTHLGCIVKWNPEQQKIQCPCHAAVFGPDGKVLAGPPPKPLPEYEVIVAGDEIKVKT